MLFFFFSTLSCMVTPTFLFVFFIAPTSSAEQPLTARKLLQSVSRDPGACELGQQPMTINKGTTINKGDYPTLQRRCSCWLISPGRVSEISEKRPAVYVSPRSMVSIFVLGTGH